MKMQIGHFYIIKGKRAIPFQVLEENDDKYLLNMPTKNPSKVEIDKIGIIWMIERDLIEEVSEDQAFAYAI